MENKDNTMKKPKMEDYGWHTQAGFDDQPSGWMLEEGEEEYEKALKIWKDSQKPETDAL